MTDAEQPLQVITMNGSVRIKTCDLELSQQTISTMHQHQHHHHHEMPPRDGGQGQGQGTGAGSSSGGANVVSSSSTAGGTSGATSGAPVGEDGQRAVDNQYSYV